MRPEIFLYSLLKFIAIDFVLTNTLQAHGQNRLVANLPVVNFRSQPREVPSPKTSTVEPEFRGHPRGMAIRFSQCF